MNDAGFLADPTVLHRLLPSSTVPYRLLYPRTLTSHPPTVFSPSILTLPYHPPSHSSPLQIHHPDIALVLAYGQIDVVRPDAKRGIQDVQ